jgi:hypothetical protein
MTKRLASTAFIVNDEEEIVGVQDVNDGEEHLFVYQNDILEIKSLVHTAVNKHNGTVNKGQVVYIQGSQGQRIALELAQANTETTSSKSFGLMYETTAKNQVGRVITEGLIEGVNTNGFNEGDLLWLSASQAGGLTATRPVAPNHGVFIGVCVRKNQNNGSIFVKVQNGVELDELHNVLISNPQNGDILKYNGTTHLWYNTQP